MENMHRLFDKLFILFLGKFLVNHSLTQCVDLGNHHSHLLMLGEDPNGRLLQKVVDLHFVTEK